MVKAWVLEVHHRVFNQSSCIHMAKTALKSHTRTGAWHRVADSESPDGSPQAKCDGQLPGKRSEPEPRSPAHRNVSAAVKTLANFVKVHGTCRALPALVHSRRCLASGPRAFAAPLRFRPVRPGPSAWHEMPGHAAHGVFALQGQLLAGLRRVMGGPRGVWRGDGGSLWLPRVRGGCRCGRSGVDAHGNPGTSITCNRTARWGAELRAGLTGRMGRSGRFPGIASRAGGAGLTGRNRRVCSFDGKSTFRERRFRMQDGIVSAGAALIGAWRSAGSAWTQYYRGC